MGVDGGTTCLSVSAGYGLGARERADTNLMEYLLVVLVALEILTRLALRGVVNTKHEIRSPHVKCHKTHHRGGGGARGRGSSGGKQSIGSSDRAVRSTLGLVSGRVENNDWVKVDDEWMNRPDGRKGMIGFIDGFSGERINGEMGRSIRGGTMSWETVSGRGGREVSYRKGMEHCLLAGSGYERRDPIPRSLPQILRVRTLAQSSCLLGWRNKGGGETSW